MKYLDVFGQEIKVGDFVAYATSCTSTGYLRRGIVTREIDETHNTKYRPPYKTVGLQLKSINPALDQSHWDYVVNESGTREYKNVGVRDFVTIGTCRRTSQFVLSNPTDSVQFKEIILIGSKPEQAFSERERKALDVCKTKLIP